MPATISLVADPADLPEAPSLAAAELSLARAFMTQGAGHFVRNLSTEVQALRIGEVTIPISLNRTEYANSYVCSPYSTFVTYAADELDFVSSRPMRLGAKTALRAIGAGFRLSRANMVVSLNNWLVSTTPHVGWRGQDLEAVTSYLCQQFPRHYLLLRSVNTFEHAELCTSLKAAGYILIPTRQVYYLDVSTPEWKRRRDVKRDQRLLAATPYRQIGHDDFSGSDFERCAQLYKALYIDKYSPHNPEFTPAFMRFFHETRILEFIGLRDAEGQIQAFAALHVNRDYMTIAFIGYATTLGQDEGIYRVLTSMVFLKAECGARFLNCGAGVGQFKRSRGAVPHTEYTVLYDAHLPAPRRVTYRVIEALMRRVGVPLMLGYGL